MAEFTQLKLASGDVLDIEASGGGEVLIARTDPDGRLYGDATCTPVEAVAVANAILAAAMECLAASGAVLPKNTTAER